ncbi:MAG: NfeD family protein [Candidatus Saelkia tenebricola]|nr:NfeD family protein [Candidatus Saelkia tenebricola]
MTILSDIFSIILGLLGAIFFFAMELFVIPGFGVMGVLGVILIAATTFTAYKNFGIEAGFYTILAGLLLTGLAFYYFTKKKLFKRATLQYRLSKEDGFAIRQLLLEEYMDKEGIALTTLRPIGIVKIEDERLDAVVEGSLFIKKDTKVKVTDIDGNKLVVKNLEEVGK